MKYAYLVEFGEYTHITDRCICLTREEVRKVRPEGFKRRSDWGGVCASDFLSGFDLYVGKEGPEWMKVRKIPLIERDTTTLSGDE